MRQCTQTWSTWCVTFITSLPSVGSSQTRGWNTPKPRWVHDLTSTVVSQPKSWPIASSNTSIDLALTPQQMPKPATPTRGPSPSQERKAFVELWTQATRGHRYPDFLPYRPVTSLNPASSLLPLHQKRVNLVSTLGPAP